MTSTVLIRQAARAIWEGGIVAYPTEGVYGLGCLPGSAATVERLLRLKSRSVAAGLILIAADLEQLDDWIQPDSMEARRLRRLRKQAITWIVSARLDTPNWLTGGQQTLAVRVTDHPVAAALCRAADSALVSTSANLSGKSPALTALGVRRRFGRALDCVLGGAVGPNRGLATEIRRARNNAVVRPGR
jgi:L-threonylcarbamoyladenylate synthase